MSSEADVRNLRSSYVRRLPGKPQILENLLLLSALAVEPQILPDGT